MGTWGIHNFENDDAADWVSMLVEEEDPDLIVLSLKEIADEEEYIEAPECCEALCAIEIIVAIKTGNMDNLPNELTEWIQKIQALEGGALFGDKVYKLAKKVIHRILKDSELQEIWEESDLYADWVEIQKNLLTALN